MTTTRLRPANTGTAWTAYWLLAAWAVAGAPLPTLPDWSLPSLDNPIANGLAVVWTIAITGTLAGVVYSLTAMQKARANSIPGQADEAKSYAIWSGIALAGVVGFGFITATLLGVIL